MGTERPTRTNSTGGGGLNGSAANPAAPGAGAGPKIREHWEPRPGAGYDSSGTPAGAQPVGMAPGLGPVELVDGNNPDRLIADVEAAAQSLPPAAADPASAGQAQPVDSGQGTWPVLTPALVSLGCDVVLPRWNIQPEERTQIAESLAECLEQVFPGGIEGPHACWVRLTVCCCGIVAGRIAMFGKLPPLFFGAPAPAKQPERRLDPNPLEVTSLTQ